MFTILSTKLSTKRQGFTLIELLVVISIIGVLAAVLLVNFVGVRGRASDAAKKNNVRQMKSALRLYYNDYQRYPASAASNTRIAGCGAAGTSSCAIGGTFSAGSPASVYMNQLPADILYYANGTGTEYLIKVVLDNPGDEDAAASQSQCAPTGKSYYSGGTPDSTDYFVCQD